MRRFAGVAAGALSGLLAALSFPPAALAPLAWVALVPLFLRLLATGGRRAAVPFLAYGVVFFSVGAWWVRTVLTPFGPPALGLVLTLLFVWPTGLAAGFLLRRRWSILLAAPIAFVLAEWLRTWLFTGFPWLFLAHSQAGFGTLIQSADLFGAYGITALIVLVNAGLAVALRRCGGGFRRSAARPLAVPGVLVVAFLVYGLIRPGTLETEPGPHVLIVQASIPQFAKREIWDDPDPAGRIFREHLAIMVRGLEEHPETQVVLWPETMYPYVVTDAEEILFEPDHPDRILEGFRNIAVAAAGRPSIVGALARTGVGGNRNSVFLIDGEGRALARYDKVHAVPGGEYIPFRTVLPEGLKAKVEALVRRTAGFVPDLTEGDGLVLMEAAGVRFAPDVCYEIMYPGLVRDAVSLGAEVIANHSNYGWFPETAELDQALDMTILRAVEVRRPVAVAANTGISGVVSPRGEVERLLVDGRDRDVAGALGARLVLCRETSVYARLGDILPFAALFALLAGFVGAMMVSRRGRIPDPAA